MKFLKIKYFEKHKLLAILIFINIMLLNGVKPTKQSVLLDTSNKVPALLLIL